MTWKEFKDLIDKKLIQLGHTEDIEIRFIDIPPMYELCIEIDPEKGLSIS